LVAALRDIHAVMARLEHDLPANIATRLTEHGDWAGEVDEFVRHNPEFLKGLRQATISARQADLHALTGQQGGPFARVGHAMRAAHAGLKQVALSPMAKIMLCALICTEIKADAWYGPTAIPDEQLVSPKKYVDNPVAWNAAVTAVKTFIGHSIALVEYIPLTALNEEADKHGINLTNARGVIEVMDLGWTVGFLKWVKHETLEWPQYAGLAIVALGCAIVNKPKSVLPAVDRYMARAQAKIGAALRPGSADPDSERNSPTFSRSQIHSSQTDVDMLLNRLDPLVEQLAAFRADLRALLPSDMAAQMAEHAGEAAPDFTANDTAAMLDSKLTEIDRMIAGAPQMASALATVRDELVALSKSRPDVQKQVFMGVWAIGQTAFLATGIAMTVRHHPMSRTEAMVAIGAFSGAATGMKLPAWYSHTIFNMERLLPERFTPADPTRREWAYSGVKIAASWLQALPEYVCLNILNRIADQHGIPLAKPRAVIEGADLLWFIALMSMVKHQKLEWQHLLGLMVVGVGVAVANAV
jgi:uncharacterized protein (DUF486 family)